jgi:Spy/CpxP family protein refolding chaperone
MSVRKSAIALSLVLAFTGMAFSQQPQTPAPPAPDNQVQGEGTGRLGRPHRRMGHGRDDLFQGFHELNLTEAQKQQQRTIIGNYLENIRPQREELFKLREKREAGTFTPEDAARVQTLRKQIRESMQGAESELTAILTPDQRAKLEELKNARKAERQEMLKRRQDFPNKTPQ